MPVKLLPLCLHEMQNPDSVTRRPLAILSHIANAGTRCLGSRAGPQPKAQDRKGGGFLAKVTERRVGFGGKETGSVSACSKRFSAGSRGEMSPVKQQRKKKVRMK